MEYAMIVSRKKSNGFMLHRFSIFNGMDNYNSELIWKSL
jgi:hypothetical protein